MKLYSRFVIPALWITLILLAGCTNNLTVRDIPRTGGTSSPPASIAKTSIPGISNAGQGSSTGTPMVNTPALPAANPVSTKSLSAPSAGLQSVPLGTAATATSMPMVNSIPLPNQRQVIEFPPDSTFTVVKMNLPSNQGQAAYQLRAKGGQEMYITIDGNAVMQVYGPNLKRLTSVLSAINPVDVLLNQNGNYYIILQGLGPVNMSIYIPAPDVDQTIPAPIPARPQQIQFPTGETRTSFTATLNPGEPLGYTLNVQAGQQMLVTTSGNATATLLAPDRATMVPSEMMPIHQWLYPLSQGGNYTLVLLGDGPVTVNVSIPTR